MKFTGCEALPRLAVVAATLVLAPMLSSGAAQAQAQQPIVMKISLAALNDPLHQFAKDFAAMLDKDAGGRIKTEIYPASQLGTIPRQIEGTQFGAIQCVITPPEFYTGVDERFEVLAVPGLVDSIPQAQRLASDPEVLKLMLGLGADKGLHGIAIFTSQASQVISKAAIRHLADLNGKKLRVFPSQFQTLAYAKYGVTSVAMSLGDALPALQQGTIDGSLAGTVIFSAMHYQDAAKFVTNVGQPMIFGYAAVSKKWYDALPPDLQRIIDKDAAAATAQANPESIQIAANADKRWVDSGGELIDLPPDEQASMFKTFSTTAAEVSKTKPAVTAAYQVVAGAAQRLK
jgi:TRAP-type transport system periplasmic protein